MTQHLPVLPILIPLVAGALLLLFSTASLPGKRRLNLVATLAMLPLCLALLAHAAAGHITIYALGAWPPPFGIVLVVDRFSAMMLALTTTLAIPVLLYAARGDDAAGSNFHALFQFQLLGINGAFLTGDLFNLFVFFEILLIASYALLLFGGGRLRTAAGLHYVVLNLTGSALFLIAVGILYGITGTLNMADLARAVATLPASDVALVHAAGLLLLLVFALKAALLPIGFWLPAAYAQASAPVAALFAILTKVGLYAILRVHFLVFGSDAGALAGLGNTLLWATGLTTLAIGAVGAVGATHLRGVIAWLVLVSVGILLAGAAAGGLDALTATLYYLLHSTWITAAMFLLAGIISERRGSDLLRQGPRLADNALGIAFFIGALALAGLPPLSGFIGKLLLLRAVGIEDGGIWLWALLLSAGLLALLALSRAGSSLFWRGERTAEGAPGGAHLACAWLLLVSAPLLTLGAEYVLDFLQATANGILQPGIYIEAVLGETREAGS